MRLPIPALILAATLAACGKDDTLAPVSASARVKVINAIGGANGVDFAVGDQRTFTALNFTSVAPSLPGTYTALPAETPLRLRVYLGSATLIDSTVTLIADASYSLIASGTSNGTGAAAPRFILLQDNLSTLAAGAIRLRALHAAPGVASVDVHAALTGTQFSITTRTFASLGFRAASTVDVPSGTYQICVLGAGLTPTANGSNCAILLSTGVISAGSVVTAMVRDPNTPSETTPRIQVTIDRSP